MATIAGRGGMPSAKSSRHGRPLEDTGLAVRVLLARVLDRDEQGLVVGREHRAAQLGTDRAAEEELGGAARFALGLERPEPVRAAGGLGVFAVGGRRAGKMRMIARRLLVVYCPVVINVATY